MPPGTGTATCPLSSRKYPVHRPRADRAPHFIRPERFASGRPAWSYLPFAAGPRTCLGTHRARLILRTALTPLCHGGAQVEVILRDHDLVLRPHVAVPLERVRGSGTAPASGG